MDAVILVQGVTTAASSCRIWSEQSVAAVACVARHFTSPGLCFLLLVGPAVNSPSPGCNVVHRLLPTASG